jgi:hypothetical protein
LNRPHHGSIHNFHEEVISGDRLRLALATTETRRVRIADVELTLSGVETCGKVGVVVDEKPRSSVTCRSERVLSITPKAS